MARMKSQRGLPPSRVHAPARRLPAGSPFQHFQQTRHGPGDRPWFEGWRTHVIRVWALVLRVQCTSNIRASVSWQKGGNDDASQPRTFTDQSKALRENGVAQGVRL